MKDLRNCLPTFAVIHGLHNDVWEQYIGHSPKSVTSRHYVPRLSSVSRGQSEALERQMRIFHYHVTEPLDQAILNASVGDSVGGILNIFEREDVKGRLTRSKSIELSPTIPTLCPRSSVG